MVEKAANGLNVSQLASKNPNPQPAGEKPDHWIDKAGTGFQNPWESFIPYTLMNKLLVCHSYPFYQPDMLSIQNK